MQARVFASVVKGLGMDEPMAGGLKRAAVSVILSDPDSPKTLLIRRAEQPGDPWSGQIAFPGGKAQPGDGNARETAARETLEEVGVDLGKAAEFLGYGETTKTHTGTMEVVPSVFLLKGEAQVKPNREVASYRWVALDEMLSPSAQSTYRMSFDGRKVELPAFAVGDYVVWGLTHRIISSLVQGSKD